MSVVAGVALITGSAQGIGRGIALRLAKDGFDIALNDVSSKRDQLCAVADDIEKIGRRVLLVPTDITVDEQVKQMMQDVVKELGGLDVLVANAGIFASAPLVSTELDDWERIMAVNARGIFLCYKYAAQQMIKQGRGGRIIGASSATGNAGKALVGAYSASKFAVRGLTQSAALELGPYNITVNSYAPGLIKTPMTAFMFDSGGEHDLGKSLARPIVSGEPEDIANVVSHLASKEAHFITGKYPLISFHVEQFLIQAVPGQCITIDGGATL